MKDYKELVEALRNGTKSPLHVAPNGFMAFDVSVVNAIANVIEQLMKERDMAVADLKDAALFPCRFCKNEHTQGCDCYSVYDKWEWRGVQEVEHEID